MDANRLDIANAVLKTIDPDFVIISNRGYSLEFSDSEGKRITKKWLVPSASFYPTCHHSIPTGGTVITAITQLIRWLQSRSALPLSTWKYWGGDKVKMWRNPDNRDRAIALLEGSDYPLHPICIFCGKSLNGIAWDWFTTSEKEGCGCWNRKCDGDRSICKNKKNLP